MVPKDVFVKIMSNVEKQFTEDRKFSKILSEILQSEVMPYDNEKLINSIILFLSNEFQLDTKDNVIIYFIYELDFGKKYKPGCFRDVKDINISTSDNLYDYLKTNLI